VNGELVGINSAIASLGAAQGSQSGSIGLGFAIPIDHAQRIAQELTTHGVATQAVLGVSTTTTPGTRGAVMSFPSNRGGEAHTLTLTNHSGASTTTTATLGSHTVNTN